MPLKRHVMFLDLGPQLSSGAKIISLRSIMPRYIMPRSGTLLGPQLEMKFGAFYWVLTHVLGLSGEGAPASLWPAGSPQLPRRRHGHQLPPPPPLPPPAWVRPCLDAPRNWYYGIGIEERWFENWQKLQKLETSDQIVKKKLSEEDTKV